MKKNYRSIKKIAQSKILLGLVMIVLGVIIIVLAIVGGGEGNNNNIADSNGADVPVIGDQTPEEAPPVSSEPVESDGERDGQFGGEEPVETNTATASGIPCTLPSLSQNAIHTGELILVNNWTPYQFPEEQELVCIYEKKSSGYYVRDLSVYLSPVAMTALDKMMVEFREQGGPKGMNVVAGYRTAEEQQHLFDQSAQRNGLEHAQKYVAQPGGSEHHTGLVVDFSIMQEDGSSRDYDGSGAYAWIGQNCQEYGFVVRYAPGKEELTGIYDEPWHFRYLGVPHATHITSLGMCLEEYIDYLKDYTFEGEHLTIECSEGTYEVWYTEGTQVYLPDSGEYQISGNNVDGVIVTVKIG